MKKFAIFLLTMSSARLTMSCGAMKAIENGAMQMGGPSSAPATTNPGNNVPACTSPSCASM